MNDPPALLFFNLMGLFFFQNRKDAKNNEVSFSQIK
jgi:hypothetical protein